MRLQAHNPTILTKMPAADQNGRQQSLPSKDREPYPANFFPIFFRNQFRIKISLPTRQVYDLQNKCAVITGSNTGLGLEASKQLLSLGLSHLVMGVRSLEKGRQAARLLQKTNTAATIDVWELDMESYDSIKRFARRCQEELPLIHAVILNAGLGPVNFSVVEATGHEKTIQINFLSTALLTVLLIPVLKSKRPELCPPRLTIVNSMMAHLSKFPNKDKRPLLTSFDDTAVTPWNAQERYSVSKLLSQLFTVELAEKVDPSDVIINLVEPGLTKGTDLQRDTRGLLKLAASCFVGVAGRPLDMGAATYVNAAFKQDRDSHGCFIMNCLVSP
jgi:NAD(P)-dependent dehydrogenase (short-subunit alcohol dehydrogenase family)